MNYEECSTIPELKQKLIDFPGEIAAMPMPPFPSVDVQPGASQACINDCKVAYEKSWQVHHEAAKTKAKSVKQEYEGKLDAISQAYLDGNTPQERAHACKLAKALSQEFASDRVATMQLANTPMQEAKSDFVECCEVKCAPGGQPAPKPEPEPEPDDEPGVE